MVDGDLFINRLNNNCNLIHDAHNVVLPAASARIKLLWFSCSFFTFRIIWKTYAMHVECRPAKRFISCVETTQHNSRATIERMYDVRRTSYIRSVRVFQVFRWPLRFYESNRQRHIQCEWVHNMLRPREPSHFFAIAIAFELSLLSTYNSSSLFFFFFIVIADDTVLAWRLTAARASAAATVTAATAPRLANSISEQQSNRLYVQL